jgi:flagellar biosynthesis GTPase FlhF
MRLSTLIPAVCLFLPIAALAQSGSPFDTGFTSIQTLFTGTIAKVASLVAIVIGGYGFAHGEQGSKNTRFAYVSVSRASEDVRIYTNDVAVLSERLSTDVTKTSAVDIQKAQVEPTLNQQTLTKEPPMTNSREHSQEELRRQILAETTIHAPESISFTADIEHRHNAPIQTALPKEASDYEWKRETGEVQSYQHTHAGSWLHIDLQGQFYDRQAHPITRENALEQAGQSPAHSMGDNAQVQSSSKDTTDFGLSL